MAAPTIPTSGVKIVSPPNGLVEIDAGPTVSGFLLASGQVTLNGATPVTVADPNFKLTSSINFSLSVVGGTVGAYPTLKTVTAGTGWTVAGTASDTSVYNWTRFG